MNDSQDDKKAKPSDPPEQQLGDTPVLPWEMPTPEEKAQAEPVKRALKDAIEEVDSPEKAERVIEELERDTAGQPAVTATRTAESAVSQVEKAAGTAPQNKKTKEVLQKTAHTLATPDKHQREIVSEAAQEVFNPEQQGAAPTVVDEPRREYLREAVLRRLKPLDALDANLFLAVNHLPHTRLLNTFFYGVTMAFNGAATWYAVTVLAALRRRHRFGELLREVALPLTVAVMLVEYPIKWYFRRKRPFISIIQAIVIGKKPGTWSFPSGHSAGAFAGAWLLNHKFPRARGLRYLTAGLVAFSRIYLGDHYPGDVASGSLLGMLFAMFFHRLFKRKRE